MGKNEKSWKDFLLSSGIPLEYSIAKILKQRKFLISPEYNYARKNENGELINFSVDLCASELQRKSNSPWYNLNLLIECKYRHPQTKWIFTPDRQLSGLSCSFIEDTFNNKYELDYTYADNFFDSYCQVYKGIEILDDKFNPKSITQALHQLAYAYVNLLINNYEEEQGSFLGGLIYSSIPLIVTTSELWMLKNNISIEDIQKSTSIQDVAVEKSALMLN